MVKNAISDPRMTVVLDAVGGRGVPTSR